MLEERVFRASVVLTIAAFVILGSFNAVAADSSSLNWVQLSPAASPPARGYPSMAYDPISQKVVLFGGYNGGYLNDTWTFDGTTWTQIQTSVAPPPRTNATMAFDRVDRVLILFGGYNGTQYMGDTWIWNGAKSTWTKASPSASPKAVTGPMLFTDPANGHVDVFGGFDGRFYQATTYQWTGATWNNLNPSTVAYARSIAVCATDGATKSTVVFAGLADLNPNNTWTWDGSNWTLQSPSTQPSDRYGSPGAYDPRLQEVIVFGGGEGGSDLNDTWAWDGTTWTELFPASSPSAREGYGMVFDSALGHIIIFGGQAGNSFLGDTWGLAPQ